MNNCFYACAPSPNHFPYQKQKSVYKIRQPTINKPTNAFLDLFKYKYDAILFANFSLFPKAKFFIQNCAKKLTLRKTNVTVRHSCPYPIPKWTIPHSQTSVSIPRTGICHSPMADFAFSDTFWHSEYEVHIPDMRIPKFQQCVLAFCVGKLAFQNWFSHSGMAFWHSGRACSHSPSQNGILAFPECRTRAGQINYIVCLGPIAISVWTKN